MLRVCRLVTNFSREGELQKKSAIFTEKWKFYRKKYENITENVHILHKKDQMLQKKV